MLSTSGISQPAIDNGYVKGIENEFGNYCLSELQAARGPMGLLMVRDICTLDALPLLIPCI